MGRRFWLTPDSYSRQRWQADARLHNHLHRVLVRHAVDPMQSIQCSRSLAVTGVPASLSTREAPSARWIEAFLTAHAILASRCSAPHDETNPLFGFHRTQRVSPKQGSTTAIWMLPLPES